MADVDMPDAPSAAPLAKKKGADGEGKKRFEVKKVELPRVCFRLGVVSWH